MTARFDPNKITFFAKTDARGKNVPFGIKAIDRTKHMYVIGKTGMGKSTLLENMAVQDMRNGEGMAFIDPHGATAETLLDYIPEERKDDVLYFAPFDMEYPISFNVMEDVGPDKRHLVVSGLMSVFEKIWVDAWSARMAYILQNTLMALLEYPDATLLGVNRMLSDKNYRKKVVDNITDPSVRSFWVDEFAKYNERYMQEAGDAIKNKIGQFTANPVIRNIIGQPKSSFDLRNIMDDQKIIIMNLSKGLVGESNANLLGSMLTTRIYLAAMSRADVSQDTLREMSNFYFYVDEFQSFANATFADILSEARKYKLNLTIAHQYIEQMEEEVRNAVFGNVGTIASFRVGPFDAEILETIFAPQFYAIDICNLGFAQIYLTLMIDGVGSPPFSAQTMPPLQKPSVSCRDIIIHSSRVNYAKPRKEVEENILAWHGQSTNTNANANTNAGGGSGNKDTSKYAPSSRNTNTAPNTRSSGTNGTNSSNSPRKNDNFKETPPRNDRSHNDNATEKNKIDERRDNSVPENSTKTKHADNQPEKHDKNLAELRSILANISQKTETKSVPPQRQQKREKQHEGTDRSQVQKDKDVEHKQHNRLTTEQHNNVTDKKLERDAAEKNPRKEVSLKDALADVLKQQGATLTHKDETQPTIVSEEPTSQKESEKKQEEKPPSYTPKSVSDAAPSKRVEQQEAEKTTSVSATEKRAPQTGETAPSTELQNPTSQPAPRHTKKDPLDPKLLERMMKVRSDDRTPLK